MQGYYQELGLFFQPANNSLDRGLAKVNTYIETGALKIFNTLEALIKEGVNYRYPDRDLAEDENADEKPKKYMDHAMDALRYVIVDLPDDPSMLDSPSYRAPNGKVVRTVTKDGELIVSIEEDDDDDWDEDRKNKDDWRGYW